VKAPNFSTVNQRGCRADARIRYDLEFDPFTGEIFDLVLVDVSSNGGTSWKNLSFIAGTSEGLFELADPVDIPDGKPAATARFNLLTDESITRDGVYIDNVRVVCTSGSPSATDLQFLDGTSMATPHVAGLAGLILAANPNLTVAQLKNAILNTVDRKASLSGKVSTGGRINARAALASVVANFTVTVNKVGTGTGTVTSNPSGIDCGVTCNGQFPQGGTVTLSAAPSPGSVFAGWSGNCGGAGACSLTTDSTVTATFNIAPPPSDDGGGGCALMPGGSGDALLPALLITALAVWLWRARRTRN
jgi:subtilisin family serine protease